MSPIMFYLPFLFFMQNLNKKNSSEWLKNIIILKPVRNREPNDTKTIIPLMRETSLTLRRQIVHWIGAYFDVSMFLDSRDKYLSMSKFLWNKGRLWNNKRRTKRASSLQNLLTINKKKHSLAGKFLSCISFS